MAAFDDLKERIKNESAQLWERIEESSAYNQLKDRFQNLTPLKQKLALTGVAFVIFLILMSIPMSSFVSGSDSLETYENQRGLIHDLFKIQQDTQSSFGLTPAPSADALKARIDSELQKAQLLPEQIMGTTSSEMPANIPKDRIDASLQVSLHKLNLRQIIDIGYEVGKIRPAIKMVGLAMEINPEDVRYFDVVYRLITLKVPVYAPPPPMEEENPGKNKKITKPKPKSFGGDE